MITDLALLQEQVARLQNAVEGLLARGFQNLPPPPQILQIAAGAGSGSGGGDGSGNTSGSGSGIVTGAVLDWNGSGYVGDDSLPPITAYPPAGRWIIYRPQSQRWEELTSLADTNVKRVRFALSQALVSQQEVDDCSVLQDWYSNADATSVDVHNEDGWQSDAGAEGLADWNPAEGFWVIVLLPCPVGTS